MRKILIGVMFGMIWFSCKHDEELKQPLKPLGPVFAGVVGENMVYTDFVPDIDIDTLRLSPYINFNYNERVLDINCDGVSDVSIYVNRSDINNRYDIMMKPLNTALNRVSYSCSSITCTHGSSSCNCYECSGSFSSQKNADRIDVDSVQWTGIQLSVENGVSFTNNYFEFKSFSKSDSSNWQPTPNRYIGFRFIESTDTLYGWMRVSIVGKAHIVVHDCAYQKR